MDDRTAGLAGSRVANPSSFQVRAARGMLNWSMLDLARSAHVSVTAVKFMETPGSPPVSEEIWATVRSAFEAAGVRFLSDEEGGQGVWLSTAG